MPIEPAHYHEEKQLPAIFRSVASLHAIDLSEDILHQMVVVASACGIADDQIDLCTDPAIRKQIADNAFSYLQGKEDTLVNISSSPTFKAYEESMTYLKTVMDTLSQRSRNALILRLHHWYTLSESRREDADLRSSLRYRL